MRRWERRLKDLSIALDACGNNYFEPELFRLNANYFLTTSRTVSFLFQKDKASIPDFEKWHEINIVTPWKNDSIMKWSVSSRNTIEKEGDLDLNSEVSATLIFSYLEEQDLAITLEKQPCLGIGIKRLMRFARSKLPSGVSDAAVIRVERTWIANTLPNHELLHAFKYIYSRMHEACTSLAIHLGSPLEVSIPDPTYFDEISTGSRGVHYIKLNSTGVGVFKSERRVADKNFSAPDWLIKLRDENLSSPPTTFEELLAFHEKVAKANILAYGNHLPMLWLYNENFKPIDYIATMPEDQASKFIFWRIVADRVHYLKARYVVWVAEAWVRSGLDRNMTKPIRNLPITGEILQVTGIDDGGHKIIKTWKILRETPESKPTLEPSTSPDEYEKTAYYIIPAERALIKVRENG